MTAPTRRNLIDRDGICVINLPGCSHTPETLDHRANRGKGGSKVLNAPYCLIAACRWCNSAKEDADEGVRADLIMRGVRVEKDSTNEKTAERCRVTPVQYPDGSWWRLLANGDRKPAQELLEAAGNLNRKDVA